MSSRRARITLQTAVTSFVSTQLPRPILSPELDNAGKVPRSFFGDTNNLDYNALSVSFYENVMPVVEGWQSVNFNNIFSGPPEASALQFVDSTEFYFSDPLGLSFDPGVALGRRLTGDSQIGYQSLCLVSPSTPETSLVRLYDRMPVDSGETTWSQVVYREADNVTVVSEFPLKYGQAISWALANGVQFFCLPGVGVFFYGLVSNSAVGTTATLQAVKQLNVGDTPYPTAAGDLADYQFIDNLPFLPEDITAICAAQGYLVVAAKNEIAYALLSGSKFNFSEFQDGAVTGSGIRIPEELLGEITALRAVPGGFVIFSEHNAVSAFYSSSNFATPWNFREISGCGGVRSVRSVSHDSTKGAVFAVTSVGMQQITLSNASEISSGFDDYLSGKVFELYDYADNEIRQLRVSSNINTRCTLIGSRYVCVSCGINFQNEFELLYVYDLQLRRWGKIRKLHADALQLSDVETSRPLRVSDLEGYTIAERYASVTVASLVLDGNISISESRQKLGLLTLDGDIVQILIGQGEASDDVTEGIVRVAGIKVSRSRNITLHTAEVDGVKDFPETQLILHPSYDGRNYAAAVDDEDLWTQVEQQGDKLLYGGLLTAAAMALTVRGKYTLSTLEMEFSLEGDR